MLRTVLIEAAGALWIVGAIYAVVLLQRISTTLTRISRRLDDIAASRDPG
jgi:hypothetical protein